MTRKAPTVCSAATVQAASRVKNSSFRPRVFRPIERAWCSSKKVTIRSFHFSSRIAIEIMPIAASWIISSGAMARILPRMMVWIFTDVGFSDTINSPIPKKEEKISPIIASSLAATAVAKQHAACRQTAGEKCAEREGQAEHIGPATPGTIEWERASPISDQPLSIR